MATALRMPKLSDAMNEATISRWLKALGDEVAKGEPVVEVETDKVIVEVEAPQAGVILEILAQEQAVVPVDGIICHIGLSGEGTLGGEPSSEIKAPSPGKNLSSPPNPGSAVGRQPHSRKGVEFPKESAPAPPGNSNEASPLARRVAREMGLDLASIPGSGIGGKVVMADLESFLPSTAAPVRSSAAQGHTQSRPEGAAGFTELPPNAMRRAIAEKMALSKQEIPHFYMSCEVDLTACQLWRTRANASLENAEVSISLHAIILKASAQALAQAPELNATYENQLIRRFEAMHVGFAVELGEGLLTPVVRDCQLKSVGNIARESALLADKARKRSLVADELNGATFTVSNLGKFDVTEFSAIINPPQVAILAIPRPVLRPVVRQGRIQPREMLTITLSADHRAVDGADAARFLEAFKAVLEHPERLAL